MPRVRAPGRDEANSRRQPDSPIGYNRMEMKDQTNVADDGWIQGHSWMRSHSSHHVPPIWRHLRPWTDWHAHRQQCQPRESAQAPASFKTAGRERTVIDTMG
eukprot:373015-Rhodomonas_salina.2